MGRIDFSGLVGFGIVVGLVLAVLFATIAFGGWWLLSHLAWV